ncbi:hypothetical protein NKG60_17855 [Mesorhizobium sp. M1428]
MSSIPVQQHSAAAPTSSTRLVSARRLIVKIGSALIGDPETGEIRGSWLIMDVVRFFARGQQVIIVTSGAVAVGSSHFNHLDRSLRIEEEQTAAAIGQVQLMQHNFKRLGFGVGQILLTREDIDNQHRLNAASTLQQRSKFEPYPLLTRTTPPQPRRSVLATMIG